jgi:hypothetical protein
MIPVMISDTAVVGIRNSFKLGECADRTRSIRQIGLDCHNYYRLVLLELLGACDRRLDNRAVPRGLVGSDKIKELIGLSVMVRRLVMRRIKQCFCTVFPLLFIILLNACLVVWRFIKSFLESKVKKEEAEEVESPSISIAGDEVSAELVSNVEPEDKTRGAEIEAKGTRTAPVEDKDISAVLAHSVELEDKSTNSEIEANTSGAEIEDNATRAVPTEDKDISVGLAPSVELEDKTTNSEIETDGTKSALVEDKDVSAGLVSNVEPEDKTLETTVEAEDDIVVLEVTEAYCVKCRQKQAIQGAREVTTKKGRPAIEGTCSVCGTKVFRFIPRGKES